MNIWVAASDNQIEKVKAFLEKGQTPNDRDANGYTCMHAAASYGHRELLEILISNGGDVNITDEEGDTPLHVVEDVETAKFLIQKGADHRLKNEDDQTALAKLDEEDEFPEVVEYLKTLLSDPEQQEFDKNKEEMPEGFDRTQLRYTMENVDLNESDPEQRRRIEEIINGDNPEEGLRKLIEETVHSQMGGGDGEEDAPAKKARH